MPLSNFNFDTETLSQKIRLSKRLIQTIIDFIVIVIIFIIFIIVYYRLEPRIRYFTCDESEIFMPNRQETLPYWTVALYATLGPILIIIFIELLNAKLLPLQKNPNNLSLKQRMRKFFICLLHALSLFVLGIAITLLLTEIGKRWVGRLRPNFIDVCKPNLTSLECIQPVKKGYVYRPIYTGGNFCTANKDLVDGARVSFPSGHASYSWYSMTFLIIYLEARLFLLRLRFIKPLIQMTAFIAAFVTVLSRISDYHHRGSDAIGGMVLGIVIALAMTLFVGRVLWEYEVEKPYTDFDLKPTQ